MPPRRPSGVARSGTGLAADLDAPPGGEAGDRTLAGHDVRPPVGDARQRLRTVPDQVAEGEQLDLERLLDRLELHLPERLVPPGRDRQPRGLVEAIRGGEGQLHGPADMMETDVLPIRRIARQEVPPDRHPGPVAEPPDEQDGPRGSA